MTDTRKDFDLMDEMAQKGVATAVLAVQDEAYKRGWREGGRAASTGANWLGILVGFLGGVGFCIFVLFLVPV